MPVWTWNKSPGPNATADPNINYQEGQAPSSLNDSGRGMMAAIAQWRDDTSGLLVTSGSASAYILATNSGFTTFAANGFPQVRCQMHATNVAGATLTVDSMTVASILISGTAGGGSSQPIPAGLLQQGGVYSFTFVPGAGWVLNDAVPNAIALGIVPIACPLLWMLPVLPASGVWIWANGGNAPGLPAPGTLYRSASYPLLRATLIASGMVPNAAGSWIQTISGIEYIVPPDFRECLLFGTAGMPGLGGSASGARGLAGSFPGVGSPITWPGIVPPITAGQQYNAVDNIIGEIGHLLTAAQIPQLAGALGNTALSASGTLSGATSPSFQGGGAPAIVYVAGTGGPFASASVPVTVSGTLTGNLTSGVVTVNPGSAVPFYPMPPTITINVIIRAG